MHNVVWGCAEILPETRVLTDKRSRDSLERFRATLKAGTAEWRNGGMAENDPKS